MKTTAALFLSTYFEAMSLQIRSSLDFQNLRDGSSLEVSPASFKITRKVGESLTSAKSFSPIGGCSLIFDYGGDHTFDGRFVQGGFTQDFNLAEIVSLVSLI